MVPSPTPMLRGGVGQLRPRHILTVGTGELRAAGAGERGGVGRKGVREPFPYTLSCVCPPGRSSVSFIVSFLINQ